MGDPDSKWKNMGRRQEYEEGKQDTYRKESDSPKDHEPGNSQQPIRKNRSEVLLAVRDEFGETNCNRPKSEALLIKNNRVACVSIEIDPATDDDESNKNDNPKFTVSLGEDTQENVTKIPLKRQSNVKEDVIESNGRVTSAIPNRKRILQKQPNVEKSSPGDKNETPSPQPLRAVKGKLTALLTAGPKKPIKSYSCPQDDDYEPKSIKRQCMSLDNDSKPPSIADGTDCPPTIRHRPMCLKSSLKGDNGESPSHNHVHSPLLVLVSQELSLLWMILIVSLQMLRKEDLWFTAGRTALCLR
ncbi:uncharacterized protein CDAR_420431 [Caerostris darwini]|uniref:Uncharacterized protein n=1 Tax=Caerostris darwini TaxID=1538125 RepID=A0AAV4TUQ2_9ARAC|nr:uncharacterized protein CDAR_420431 [Caerostris darwini]